MSRPKRSDAAGVYRGVAPNMLASAAARVAKIKRLAARQGRIYHERTDGGHAAIVIRALGGKRMLSRQDWIYDWRVS